MIKKEIRDAWHTPLFLEDWSFNPECAITPEQYYYYYADKT